ncbi:hypothetical protein BJV82DRAFT_611541 [Fennellomyces sp. T-0311]|nr:hypothetical protein BJV82DRAFT_611541 [Fennellomyces sp. T-0311]
MTRLIASLHAIYGITILYMAFRMHVPFNLTSAVINLLLNGACVWWTSMTEAIKVQCRSYVRSHCYGYLHTCVVIKTNVTDTHGLLLLLLS